MSIRSLVNLSLEIDLEQTHQALSELKMKRSLYQSSVNHCGNPQCSSSFSIMFGEISMMRLERVLRLSFAFAFFSCREKSFAFLLPLPLRPPLSLVLAHIWTRYGFPSNTDHYRRLCHALRSWNRYDQCRPRSDELPPQFWDEQTSLDSPLLALGLPVQSVALILMK